MVNSLEDLCGVTVATTRGSREMVFADEHQPKCAAAGKQPINALAFNDGNGAAEALMSRRADLFWLGSTAISYFVAQSKGRDEGGRPLHRYQLYRRRRCRRAPTWQRHCRRRSST